MTDDGVSPMRNADREGWLPGDDDHPRRPDWPIVRHLTYHEIHGMELGGLTGFLATLTYAFGGEGVKKIAKNPWYVAMGFVGGVFAAVPVAIVLERLRG